MPSSLNHDWGGGLDGGGTGVARCRFNIVLISHTVGRGRNPSGVTGAGGAAPAPLAGPFAFSEALEDVRGEKSAGIGIGAVASWDVVGSDCVIATSCRCVSLPATSSGGVAMVSLVADVPPACRSVCLRRGV